MFNWQLLGLVLLVATTACQPATKQQSSGNQTNSPNTNNVLANNNAPLPAQCDNIPLQMSAITTNSDLQSLTVVNQALKNCVPLVPLETRQLWLDASWKMYERFLNMGQQSDDGVWDEFSGTIEGYADESNEDKQARLQRQTELWPKLRPRMKQMSKWLGQEYIDNFYIGEGMMQLRRHPQYVIDVFAPYLPTDEQVFVTELGRENTALTTNDAALVVSWAEVSQRTLFWERYLKQYPQSRYHKQAEYLFALNQAILYQGLDNSPVIDNTDGQLRMNDEALAVHQQLANTPSSQLAKKSATLLQWLQEQQALYAQADATAQENMQDQLHHEYKKIKVDFPNDVPAGKNSYYNCALDAICHIVRAE